jgi:aryl-alcohol dehydrogenase-like predicted oxidoreductase
MQKVNLEKTGQQISCIGLGTMYFGSKVDEKTSFDILDFYAAQGGTFLDSANKYASWIPGFKGGESEMLIGKWLNERKKRTSMVISSKVGFAYGEIPRSLKKEIIIAECEKSLKRMKVETIDLYFAHAFDTQTPLTETMEAFYQLKRSGKIRFAGASNFYAWQLAEANSIANQQGWEGFCCLQQRHTYLEPTLRTSFGAQLLLTPEIANYCETNEITTMAYSPLLAGAYVDAQKPIPIQYQSVTSDFRLKVLKEIATELNVSANAVVLAWMIQTKTIPMVTGSSVNQINENFSALKFKLADEQLQRLEQDVVEPNKY